MENVFLFLGLTALYLLPALIAAMRNHHNALAIFVLNLLTGWTAIGYLIALVWAFTAVRPPAPPAQN